LAFSKSMELACSSFCNKNSHKKLYFVTPACLEALKAPVLHR
jgi:hypothetical protein